MEISLGLLIFFIFASIIACLAILFGIASIVDDYIDMKKDLKIIKEYIDIKKVNENNKEKHMENLNEN